MANRMKTEKRMSEWSREEEETRSHHKRLSKITTTYFIPLTCMWSMKSDHGCTQDK